MNRDDDLRQLEEDHRMGVLSDEEFARRKAVLADSPPEGGPPSTMSQEARQWAMFIHLSQLANLLVPPAGTILPIVLWQVKKNDMPGIDAHGKMVTNFLISILIYGFVSFILSFVLIGIPLLIAVAVISIVFPIIGGIKANNGEFYKYPLTITFIK